MSQQINLLNPQLLSQKVAFSAATMASYLLGILVLGGALSAYVMVGERSIQSQLTDLQTRHDDMRVRLDALEVPPDDHAVAAEQQKMREIAAQKKRLTELKTVQAELAKHQDATLFSKRLVALTHEKVPGVWLTSIEFNAEQFRLQGWSLNPAQIPEYLKRLSQQSALQKLPLSALKIERPATETGSLHAVAFSVNPKEEAQ
ncbi:MAG: PilN domain-containing protein [Thiobacillus sp.]